MNTAHRHPLPGTSLDHFDARAAVDAIQPGAFDRSRATVLMTTLRGSLTV